MPTWSFAGSKSSKGSKGSRKSSRAGSSRGSTSSTVQKEWLCPGEHCFKRHPENADRLNSKEYRCNYCKCEYVRERYRKDGDFVNTILVHSELRAPRSSRASSSASHASGASKRHGFFPSLKGSSKGSSRGSSKGQHASHRSSGSSRHSMIPDDAVLEYRAPSNSGSQYGGHRSSGSSRHSMIPENARIEIRVPSNVAPSNYGDYAAAQRTPSSSSVKGRGRSSYGHRPSGAIYSYMDTTLTSIREEISVEDHGDYVRVETKRDIDRDTIREWN